MDRFVRLFIRSSLVWLGVGVAIGLLMAFAPAQATVYRPAHAHANLAGFVSMMIFGVAYHVLPRFTGQPLHAPKLALAHVWLANAGLLLLVVGWLARGSGLGLGGVFVPAGGLATAAGAACFIFNIWKTLDAAEHAATRLTGIGIRTGRTA